ncbi:flagellar brake protein [Massilia arenosa]|uniref:Flagellar brake protein n=1 Tax=Zemynaea arenosa TaxID=2561931 RepID=A0A4Y9SJ90_9BURK|nr:flagellar brake protein [Massilia arenosa]TFW25488.1 flagellar brake protein [Massilia arenosa]
MSQTQAAEPASKEFEFEAMNLQVGGRLQFITHRTIKPAQHFSTLIGWVKDEYMIVRIPMEHGAAIALAEGDKVTIRAFSGVNVCSFASTVVRVFPRPVNYVHITFPTSIQGTSLRAAMRVKVDIPVQVTPEHYNAQPMNMFMVNLSVSGALVESPRRIPMGCETVKLSFTLIQNPGNHQVIVNTRASIKNVSAAAGGPAGIGETFSYGVQFLDLEPTHYTLLQNITYEALIADRQKIV